MLFVKYCSLFHYSGKSGSQSEYHPWRAKWNKTRHDKLKQGRNSRYLSWYWGPDLMSNKWIPFITIGFDSCILSLWIIRHLVIVFVFSYWKYEGTKPIIFSVPVTVTLTMIFSIYIIYLETHIQNILKKNSKKFFKKYSPYFPDFFFKSE